MQQIWNKKILPHEGNLFKKKQDGVNLILEDSSYVLFDNYFAIKTFPEFMWCEIKDIRKKITQDR